MTACLGQAGALRQVVAPSATDSVVILRGRCVARRVLYVWAQRCSGAQHGRDIMDSIDLDFISLVLGSDEWDRLVDECGGRLSALRRVADAVSVVVDRHVYVIDASGATGAGVELDERDIPLIRAIALGLDVADAVDDETGTVDGIMRAMWHDGWSVDHTACSLRELADDEFVWRRGRDGRIVEMTCMGRWQVTDLDEAEVEPADVEDAGDLRARLVDLAGGWRGLRSLGIREEDIEDALDEAQRSRRCAFERMTRADLEDAFDVFLRALTCEVPGA